MKITCPSCGTMGEIPVQSQSKALRCRKCGKTFHPNPTGATRSEDFSIANSDSQEQSINIDGRASPPKPDLRIQLDDEASLHRPARTKLKKSTIVFALAIMVIGVIGSISIALQIRSSGASRSPSSRTSSTFRSLRSRRRSSDMS